MYRHQRKDATKCLPLAELEGKVSPLVTDEVLLYLRHRRYIITFGRSMIAPTVIDFSADETVANGTDKSVPYKGTP